MRKYRVVIRLAARKVTRHLRASDRSDAERQAMLVASALEPDAMRAVLGPPVVVSITEMGAVG